MKVISHESSTPPIIKSTPPRALVQPTPTPDSPKAREVVEALETVYVVLHTRTTTKRELDVEVSFFMPVLYPVQKLIHNPSDFFKVNPLYRCLLLLVCHKDKHYL